MQLLTLGMFIFGTDSAAYQALQRNRDWRHETSDRFGARAAAQYAGPGADRVSLSGLLVPEIGHKFSSLETIAAMADAGDTYPLIDGLGRIFGNYRIVSLEEEHLSIMAQGVPRHVGFRLELERGEDQVEGAA